MKSGPIAPRNRRISGRIDHLLKISVSGYRTSVKNGKLSSLVKQNASPDDNSSITATVSFRDVTEMKLCPDFSRSQLVLRIACGTETILIHIKNRISKRAFVDCELFSYTGQPKTGPLAFRSFFHVQSHPGDIF
ncbi:hypothetical protein TNCV_1733651 [Trichonephila clavipes]|nr:hypothetical protein TNCV_1733651 [Trichonephila clavipes]